MGGEEVCLGRGAWVRRTWEGLTVGGEFVRIDLVNVLIRCSHSVEIVTNT